MQELTEITVIAHQLIISHNMRITMQWIPGHLGIPGNHMADGLAKRRSR